MSDSKNPQKTPSQKDLFLELAQPDKDGFSRTVHSTEFVERYEILKTTNGCSWGRDDGPLGRLFNIERQKKGGRVVAVRLHGFNKNPIQKSIPAHIKREIKKRRCVVLDISKVEVDHKDGRYDDRKLQNPKTVAVDHFQPLSKGANNAKRSHCKKCKETKKRYDARTIGYPVGQVQGNGVYRGSCVGCYWHDPIEFRRLAFEKPKDENK